MTTYSEPQLEALWISAGGAPGMAPFAGAVARAESGGNSASVSKTSDVGVWQINAPTWVGKIPGVPTSSAVDLTDPTVNARAAVAISRGGTDWHPWCTAWSDGACGTKGGTYLGAGTPALKNLTGGAPPAPGAPGAPSSPGASGATSGQGLSADPQGGGNLGPAATQPAVSGLAGALGTLDSTLNPSTSLWSAFTNPLGTTEKIALLVVARSGLFFVGLAMIGAGVWLAVGRHVVPGIAGAIEGAAVGGPAGAAVGAAAGASKTVRKVKTAHSRGQAAAKAKTAAAARATKAAGPTKAEIAEREKEQDEAFEAGRQTGASEHKSNLHKLWASEGFGPDDQENAA